MADPTVTSQSDKTSEQYLRLTGEYDLAREREVAALFDLLDGDRPITIDLSEVTYMDSSCFRQLARLRTRAVKHQITLDGVRRNVARVMELLGFQRVFEIKTIAHP